MADLILQYRSLRRKITRFQQKKDRQEKGTVVSNFSQTEKPKTSDTTATSPAAVRSDGKIENITSGDPLVMLDASAYIFRAYHSMPAIHRGDGMPTGAVLGFCNMMNLMVLQRLLDGECPRLVLVFDAKGKTFRHDIYDDYKANRQACPMDLIPQFDLIRDAAEAYGIQQLEATNYEADDVIATLVTMALKEGVSTKILSGDKDLMQLITPPDEAPSCQMFDPIGQKLVLHDDVVEKWGVTPDKLGDVLALAGDSSDNVPGVPGIGPKTAATLISEYGSLDKLLEQVDSVKLEKRRQKLIDNAEQAKLSRQLVNLVREIPFDNMTFPENVTSVADLRMAPLNGERLLAFYDSIGLKQLKDRVQARIDQRKASTLSKNKSYYNKKRPKAIIPTPDDYKDVPF